jgi:hypothetical protein
MRIVSQRAGDPSAGEGWAEPVRGELPPQPFAELPHGWPLGVRLRVGHEGAEAGLHAVRRGDPGGQVQGSVPVSRGLIGVDTGEAGPQPR